MQNVLKSSLMCDSWHKKSNCLAICIYLHFIYRVALNSATVGGKIAASLR